MFLDTFENTDFYITQRTSGGSLTPPHVVTSAEPCHPYRQ
jgi:hypothetical protein